MAAAISKVWDMAAHNGKADDMSYIGHDQLKGMTDAFSNLSAVVFEDFIFQSWKVEVFHCLTGKTQEWKRQSRWEILDQTTQLQYLKIFRVFASHLHGCKETTTRQHGFVKNQLISFLTD